MAINEGGGGGSIVLVQFLLEKGTVTKYVTSLKKTNLPQATAASYYLNAWSVALANIKYCATFGSKA